MGLLYAKEIVLLSSVAFSTMHERDRQTTEWVTSISIGKIAFQQFHLISI